MFQYPEISGRDVDMLEIGGVASLAQLAERYGWSGIAFTEHPTPSVSWIDAGGHQSIDPFAALAHAAAVTTKLQLLTYLAVLPYRNPGILAKSAATVDRLSDGRFILGAGTGYLKSEYRAAGVDFEERNQLFDEALDVLPLHWSGNPYDYQGMHFSCRGTIGLPRPIRQPIPIWIGGNSRLTLRRVAQRGQGWMPLTGPADMFATVRTPGLVTTDAIAAPLAELRELAGDRFDNLDIIVAYRDESIYDEPIDIERHREAFGHIAELGATWILIPGPTKVAPAAAEFIEAVSLAFTEGARSDAPWESRLGHGSDGMTCNQIVAQELASNKAGASKANQSSKSHAPLIKAWDEGPPG
jgi:probable F420-dependent oxidoreductase